MLRTQTIKCDFFFFSLSRVQLYIFSKQVWSQSPYALHYISQMKYKKLSCMTTVLVEYYQEFIQLLQLVNSEAAGV